MGNGRLSANFTLRGPARAQIFLDKVESGKIPEDIDHLVGKNGFKVFGMDTFVSIDPDSEELDILRSYLQDPEGKEIKQLNLITLDGDIIRLSQLEKTSEFKGEGSSSNMTEQTVWQEAGQCIVCSFRRLPENLEQASEDLVDNSRLSLGEGLKVSEVLEKVKSLSKDSIWNRTFTGTAEELRNLFGSEAVYHYGDVLQQTIQNKFVEVRTNKKLSKDKWNPADIWVSRGNWNEVLNRIIEIHTLEELTNILTQTYLKELTGVSLKKSSNPAVHEINAGNQTVETSISNIRLRVEVDPQVQEGLDIIFSRGDYKEALRFRRNGTAFRIERLLPEGGNARHGNMGQSEVSNLLSGEEINLLSTIKSFRQLKRDITASTEVGDEARQAEQEGGELKTDLEELVKDSLEATGLFRLYREYFQTDFDTFILMLKSCSAESLATKYVSLNILSSLGVRSLRRPDTPELYKFVVEARNYCASEIPGLSCPHVKIS